MQSSRYDILFEPITLGPVTAPNRFYQVPHCTGMGWHRPKTLAAMRGIKAEGGWGVVCTEYCSVHESTDDGYYPYARLWNDEDIRANALMTDAVHEHGALAGVELCIGGNYVANTDSRVPTLGMISRPSTNVDLPHPFQCRRLDKEDIRNVRKWQRDAAKRAIEAGFDIVYVYATHGYLLSEFLSATINTRTDEYGGSLENRTRLVRELIAETRDAIGDKAALAVRFAADLSDPETYDAFAMMADMPDLWDLTVHDYGIEMGASRFVKESALENSIAKAKSMTSKPVAAVGRFTSPDTMARVVLGGVQDMIGAARPSIADPFLPVKIREGRPEDIRECIGCNICYAHNSLGVPIRCTQNPTMGEEHRKGWHPERIATVSKAERVLVVGAGPAGLEAARALGQRGYDVMLAEASRDLGGRVTQESKLPGLSEWARVRDWRVGQIEKMTNVEIFRESRLGASDVLSVGADRVLVATGASWTVDGIGRHRDTPVPRTDDATVVSADTVLSGGDLPDGPVLIHDDDHYYLAAVLALALRQRGIDVTYMTPGGRPASWTRYTNEQCATIKSLADAGVTVLTNRLIDRVERDHVVSHCVLTGTDIPVAADWVIPLTRREAHEALFRDIEAAMTTSGPGAPKSVQRIGDCDAPGIIATAVYSGYKAAVEL
ncbi:FAD-dependent oxidoreductase [Rhodospirillaceae bacterium KN72]|uniref:FAD-dependent oxidoreductase n=1 Tax=Pacificispira spongiicola TaxID=2729598 RepID=A0A7Y0E2Q4_9PROT|nr:FAD-dependent oxidoreductase [Pacificispira spongiicola]NMM46144.1 FAD-dependent oxidoreductase [Pacificispira spongiicola]